jgi:hypothetical protein
MDRRAIFSQALLARHFVGEAFMDELFHTDNNEREKACAWKIQSYLPLFSPLTKGSWFWRAVGIPLDLIDKSAEGDIDLMFAMRPPPTAEGWAPTPIYRCFELKTSKVKRSGEVKSLKDHKFQKTIKQLEKLLRFGAPQVFLLEAFIVEAGFAQANAAGMPVEVRNSIAGKLAQLKHLDCGLATLPIEQLPGYAENATGRRWPVETVKQCATRPVRGPFAKLVAAVEEYATAVGATNFKSVVTYCYHCKSLTAVPGRGPYFCGSCKAALLS